MLFFLWLLYVTLDMFVPLPSNECLEIWQRAHSCCRHNLLQWARPIFVAMDIHNFADCVLSFRVTCWMFNVHHSPADLFFLFIFSFSSVSASETVPVAIECSSLAISTSSRGYCYECYIHSTIKVVLMLHRLSFHLSGKVFALHSSMSR